MSRRFVTGALFGALIAVGTLTATSAVAGTGAGGIFNLGRSNKVKVTTTLTGTTSGASLAVVNRSTAGTATGLSITTSPNRAPFRVSSTVQVPNLNASYLGGKPSSAFLPVAGTAANSSKLQGKSAADFLPASGTAVNASKLGGASAAEYVRRCDPQGSGQFQGAVAAKAVIDGSSATGSFSQTGVYSSWICTGQNTLVQRKGVGVYDVSFGDQVVDVGGIQFIGFPFYATPEVPMVSVWDQGFRATVYGPYQCAVSPPPYRICLEVRLLDASGVPADGRFNLALL